VGSLRGGIGMFSFPEYSNKIIQIYLIGKTPYLDG
jgi:hypothetical protein